MLKQVFWYSTNTEIWRLSWIHLVQSSMLITYHAHFIPKNSALANKMLSPICWGMAILIIFSSSLCHFSIHVHPIVHSPPIPFFKCCQPAIQYVKYFILHVCLADDQQVSLCKLLYINTVNRD